MIERAEQMAADAVAHKRASAMHRRLARERMEDLRRFCERNGIEFELVTKQTRTESDRHGPGNDTS